MQFNAKHITETLEDHVGSWDYYLRIAVHQYSLFAMVFVLIGFFSLLKKNLHYKLVILYPLVVFYSFFTFVVATKSSNYVSYLQFLFFILMAIGFEQVYKFTQSKIRSGLIRVLLISGILAGLFITISEPVIMYNYHVHDKGGYYFNGENRYAKRHNAEKYRTLADYPFEDKSFVINLPPFENIDFMFFTGVNANFEVLSETLLSDLDRKGHTIYYFRSINGWELPSYLTENPKYHEIEIDLMR